MQSYFVLQHPLTQRFIRGLFIETVKCLDQVMSMINNMHTCTLVHMVAEIVIL